jgi:hypothetical protein
MIPVNRDTIMTVAVIVCALGIIFLFKELNKTKDDMNAFKVFSTQVVKRLTPAPEPAPEPEPEPVSEPVAEEKKEE